ncbi:MAG: VOC family protein [Proteobacteria bacterium]|nr:VOC family protein [Pseudomonadota bacterium]
MKLWFNLLCRDVTAQFEFYRTVLGLPEAQASRSPIYRALETADFQFGFNAAPAYGLLGLADRQPAAGERVPVVAYATLMLEGPDAVDAVVTAAQKAGGRVVKPPYATYYGQWQAVLADPEDNIFRVSAIGLPAGTTAPPLPPG